MEGSAPGAGLAAARPHHAADLLRLAAPLAVAQLSQTAMGVTDTVLLGRLGGDALAVGGLATNLFFVPVLVLQGVLTSVSVLVAHAQGAGRPEQIPGLYRSGLALAVLLSLPAVALMGFAEPILLALGEPPALARDAGRYLDVLRWGAPAALVGVGLMRALLPALGQGRWLLGAALLGAVANGGLGWGLIHGAGGLPALGAVGPAAATVAVLWGMAAGLLAALHLRPGVRHHVSPGRPSPRAMGEMLRLGLPVGATVGVETGLFTATGLLAGLLGPASLAAHQVALNVAVTAFMVPLAIGQAANVQVGRWAGAGERRQARRAGFTALALGGGFMVATGTLLLAAPGAIVGLYLDPARPGTAEAAGIAASLLGVAGVFQVADGVQTVAAGALRGLKDTRVPMLVAAGGYWGVGFPVAHAAAFALGWGAVGLWWGLAAGLAVVAGLLTWRFHVRSQIGEEPTRNP